MAVTADRVAVEVEARVDRYNRRVAAAQRKFEQSMGRITASARRAEAQTQRSFAGIGRGFAGLLATAGGVVALGRLRRGVEQAVAELDEIAKSADKLGVTTDALQELRIAAELAGVQTRTFDLAFQRFVRRSAEAARGTGEAEEALKQLNIQLRDASGSLRPAETLFGEVADAIREIEDPAERVRIAFKLFDSEGVAVINMLQQGSAALDENRRKARDLGTVYDKDLIRQTVKLRDEMTLLERQLSTDMNTALVRLGPLLRDVGRVLIFVAESAATAREGFRRLFAGEMLRSGEDAIVQRLGRARAELQATQDQIDRLTSGEPTTGGAIIPGRAAGDRRTVQATPENFEEAAEELERLQAKAGAAEAEVRKLENALTAARGGAQDLVTPTEPPLPGAAGGGALAGLGSAAETEERTNALQDEIDALARRTAELQKVNEAQAALNPAMEGYQIALEAARIEAELLALAEAENVEVTAELAQRIRELAEAYAVAEAEANKLGQGTDDVADRTSDFGFTAKRTLSGFIQDIRNGVEATDALANALDQIGAKLFDLSLNAILGTGGGQAALSGFLGALGFDRGGPTGGRRGQPAGIVHGEEYVVRAGPAQTFRPLLEAINDGRRLPGFQHGGMVPSVPNFNVPDLAPRTVHNSRGGDTNVSVKMDVHGVQDVDSFRRSEPQMMADLQRKLSNVARRGTA